MPTIASPRFYVYILCRPNGKPFYVGKGKGARLYAHDREARLGHKCPKCSIIRKIWKSGGEVQRFVVFTTDDEHEALAHERELIALYGRQTLANLTDGGEGPSGASPSVKTRTILRQRTRDHFAAHPEARAKFDAAAAAYLKSPEGKAHRSALNKARYENPSEREQTADHARRAWAASPERREKQSARMKALYSDPAERAKQAKSAHPNSPETRAKISAIRKAQANRPEERAAISARARDRFSDPEARAKQSERMKSWWAERKANKEKN